MAWGQTSCSSPGETNQNRMLVLGFLIAMAWAEVWEKDMSEEVCSCSTTGFRFGVACSGARTGAKKELFFPREVKFVQD